MPGREGGAEVAVVAVVVVEVEPVAEEAEGDGRRR